MFRIIAILRYWAASRRLYRRGHYQDAIAAYKAYAELSDERTRHRAYFATLLVLNEEYDAALKEFEAIASGKIRDSKLTEAEMQYVLHYSKMHVCGLRNDPTKRVHYNALKSIQVRWSLARLLPISKHYIGPT